VHSASGEPVVLELTVAPSDELPRDLRNEILALCHVAYEEDVTELFGAFGPATHVVGHLGATLASHAMWVTRLLQAGDGPLLQTAYEERVMVYALPGRTRPRLDMPLTAEWREGELW